MDLAAPKAKPSQSSLYRCLKKFLHCLGVEGLIDNIIARLNNEDRMIRLHKEALYQGLFQEFCRHCQVPHIFYPLGGGANYSLLYLLGRICAENQLEKVLELGAGQSTLLLEHFSKTNNFQRITLESSEFWAKEISDRVGATVNVAELIPFDHNGHRIQGYSLDVLSKNDKFNLVLVDGPNGSQRFSRLGVIEVIKKHLSSEFIIVFDDAERDGEQETIALSKQIISEAGIEVFEKAILGTSSQVILCTKGFERVRYY